MNHVISFSSGLSSALTVERALERYGCADTHVVFMDTTIEDDDNYRFMHDCEARWMDAYGMGPIVVLRDGRTPYQVAEDRQIIPNQKIAPCTFVLKIELFVNWMRDTFGDDDVTVYIGYDFTEAHRCGPTRDNYEARGWGVDFPLLWKPYEFREYADAVREDWGIEPPRMYAMGYTHANCGGRCVKQGLGDWKRTLVNWPERYAEAEAWEQAMRDHPVRKDYAILRDFTGGEVGPLTLRQFRARVEAEGDGQMSLFDLDASGGCVSCGVGDFVCAPAAGE